MKLLAFLTVTASMAQEAETGNYDEYQPYEGDYTLDYYTLDQNINALNLDSDKAGFGAEEDIEEVLPEDVQKSQEVEEVQTQPARSSNRPTKGGGRNYNTNGNNGNSGYPQPNLQQTVPTITCWHCEADSYELCGQTGYNEICHANQEVCELVVRQRMGYITQIHMGCKQRNACENNKMQNFQSSNPAYTQCRPEAGYTHSVCRQCCDSDLCTKEPWWWPADRAAWAA